MDDDLAPMIAKPPPPAPARREAAINEAMRRFDGRAEAPRAARKSGWSWRGSQQAVGWASAALVALVGLPTAWTLLGQGDAPVPSSARQSSAASEVAVAPADNSEVVELADAIAPPVAPDQALQDRVTSDAAAPASASAPSQSGRLVDQPVVVSPMIASVPPPPPPPPPSAPAATASETTVQESRAMVAQVPQAVANGVARTADDVVVTGSRRAAPAPETNVLSDDAQADRALADLNRAVRLDPKSARAYHDRSRYFRKVGDLRRARADAARAAELDPRYPAPER